MKSDRREPTATSQEQRVSFILYVTQTGRRRQLLVLDAKGHTCTPDVLTETYVKPRHLPDTKRCWLLKQSMHCTLPAAAGRQHSAQKVGADMCLLSGSKCPCAFGHEALDLDVVVRGDVFIIAGSGEDLEWLTQKLNESLELGYHNEAVVQNRCVTHSDTGLAWVADPRPADLAVAELGPQAARPQTSPGGASQRSRSLAKSAAAQLEKQHEQTSHAHRAAPAARATRRVGVSHFKTRRAS